MQKFTTLHSKIISLPRRDVDTDLIIPAQYLTGISREGYGKHLFQALRDENPKFIFNNPEISDRKILITGENFGCGSSREHAVWALMDWGIRVIIAPSFSDIFSSNSAKNGLLLISLEVNEMTGLFGRAENQEYEISVDLENQLLSDKSSWRLNFDYDSFRKHCLLNGLEDLDYLLSCSQEITAHFSKLPSLVSKR